MKKVLEKKEVDELVLCKNCKTTYVHPVILPCFKKICSDCVEQLSVNEKFNCCFCKKIHEVPLDGFPLDEDLNDLIKKKFETIYSNKYMEQLNRIVKELEAYSETIEIKGKGLENDLSEYCSSIRNKIDTAAEETMEQIKKIRDDYIKIIKDYENENLKNLENNKQKTNEYKVELDRYIDELKQHLNDRNIDEEKSKQLFEKVGIKKNDITKWVENIDLLKFNSEKIDFIRNEHKKNEKLLGELNYSKVKLSFEFECNKNAQKDFETNLNKTIVSGSFDKTLKVWNIETGQCIQTLQGHTSSVFCVSVIDKSKIVSGSSDNTLKVWNIETGQCIQTLQGHTSSVVCVSVIDKSNI